MNELFNQSAHQMAVTVEKAREYINDAKADNTKRAYRADWQDFVQWCHSNSICPLPAAPDTVCL
ncbi:MAG TPA: integrase, partial [Candidatus Rifleibacterium sp.]|nr:integrase [Candidatus Rifleibacterium sp.]